MTGLNGIKNIKWKDKIFMYHLVSYLQDKIDK